MRFWNLSFQFLASARSIVNGQKKNSIRSSQSITDVPWTCIGYFWSMLMAKRLLLCATGTHARCCLICFKPNIIQLCSDAARKIRFRTYGWNGLHSLLLSSFFLLLILYLLSLHQRARKKCSTQANFKMLMRKAVLFHGGSDKKVAAAEARELES